MQSQINHIVLLIQSVCNEHLQLADHKNLIPPADEVGNVLEIEELPDLHLSIQ